MTQPSKRYWVIGLTIIGFLFIPNVFAINNNGCIITDHSSFLFNSNYNLVCLVEQTNHNQQMQIQEQNQTNHLLAKLYCSESMNYVQDGWNKCMSKVLGETK